MMRFRRLLYHLYGLLYVMWKRLWSQRGLTVATLLGVTVAVALTAAVPLYADAVQFRLLEQRLLNEEGETTPPFTYMYRYVGSWDGPLEWEALRPVDQYLSSTGSSALGLPRRRLVRHIESDLYRLYPGGDSNYDNPDASLARVGFGTTTGIEEAVELVEGRLPVPASTDPSSPIEVLVSEELATEIGLQAGEAFNAYNPRGAENAPRTLPVYVSGVWRPRDAESDFWFYRPNVLSDLMLVPEATFAGRLAPALQNEVNLALWYLVMDGSRVGVEDVDRLAAGAEHVKREVAQRLPNTSEAISPLSSLYNYREAVGTVRELLVTYSIPLIGLILAFIALVASLAIEGRRNEIAVLRSRGATMGQIIGLAVLEGLLVGGTSLVLGLGGGLALTQLMGRMQGFLVLAPGPGLRVALTETAVHAALVAVGLSILAQLLPTLGAARHTVISYKQEVARQVTRPWWQRAWLDILLLVPALYALYLVRRPGALGDNPLENPLLLLLPALVALAFTLLALRLLPWFMELIAWLLARSDNLTLLMAARHLARAPGPSTTPVMLVALTVSLSLFTASLAQTMDFQLYEQMLYRVGADANLVGPGRATTSVGYGPSEGESPVQSGIFLPLSEYLEFPGVEDATRVGRFNAISAVGRQRHPGTYMGIDRDAFGRIAFWRRDFASDDLGLLLNKLATTPDGVLVPQSFLREQGLRVGDFFALTVQTGDSGEVPLSVQIVGTFHYFPTWYPQDAGTLVVGNLENLFDQAGGELPYEMWLRTAPTFDEQAFEEALHSRRLHSWNWQEPYDAIERERMRPERQGIFGILSVGLVAAALLTVLGFSLYAWFSFRRRLVELGILRAVGLTTRQLLIWVATELLFLIGIGLILGVLVGMWVSQRFIPLLQGTLTLGQQVPPYLVEMAWPAAIQVASLFGLLFVVALVVLALSLKRMRLFQAVKLGETV